jgi:hypothetical protein
MKSEHGGPCAFRGYHGYEAQTLWLLTSATQHDIHLYHIAVCGEDLLQFSFGRGGGDVFNVYFGAHNSTQSLSQVFVRVAYPVEPFGFRFVSNHSQPFLPCRSGNGLGQAPDLFEQLDDGEADDSQSFHTIEFGFNFPQSGRCGKKDGPATISVYAKPS